MPHPVLGCRARPSRPPTARGRPGPALAACAGRVVVLGNPGQASSLSPSDPAADRPAFGFRRIQLPSCTAAAPPSRKPRDSTPRHVCHPFPAPGLDKSLNHEREGGGVGEQCARRLHVLPPTESAAEQRGARLPSRHAWCPPGSDGQRQPGFALSTWPQAVHQHTNALRGPPSPLLRRRGSQWCRRGRRRTTGKAVESGSPARAHRGR